MKSILKTFLVGSAICLSANFVQAQALMPQPSSGQTIIQDFGLGKITLNYSRPNVKDRAIFGDLVPYNQVWRTGANGATSITFTDDVSFGGKPVKAGTYAIFSIPTQSEWTVILSKNAQQWGSYTYNQADDVARVTVKPTALAQKVESFTMAFANVSAGALDLVLSWDKTQVSVPLSVDFDAKVMANIEKAMAGDKKPYFQAEQYYYTNNKDIKQALAWVNEADKTSDKAPWVKLWKARIQLKAGDKKGAKQSATEGLSIAKELNNGEYVKLNQEFLNGLK